MIGDAVAFGFLFLIVGVSTPVLVVSSEGAD